MTSPSVQKLINDKWTISLIQPSGISAEDATKLSGHVTMVTEPGRLMSNISFLGVWSDMCFLEDANRLQRWIEDEPSALQVHFSMNTATIHLHALTQNEFCVPLIGRSKDFSGAKT